MKKYLISLFFAALASAAWAQSPAVVQPAQGNNNVTPVSARAAPAVMTIVAPAAAGSHAKDCCPQTKTVCVSQPTTVTKTKVLFSSSCETACHKGILQLLKKGGDCDSCQADGSCGHPYVKRDLYKRVEKTECPSYKCVPTQVPVCETPKCATPCTTPCANGTCCPSTAALAKNKTATTITPVGALVIPLSVTTPPEPTATPIAVRPTLGFAQVP